MGSPWAFKIDYDKAIADDEREIAALLDPLAVAVFASLTPDEWAAVAHSGSWDLVAWAAERPEMTDARLAIVGMSRSDLACYAFACDSGGEAYDWLLARGFAEPPPDGRYSRGEALARRFADLQYYLFPGDARAERVRAAKARLAKHKRNKAKNGS